MSVNLPQLLTLIMLIKLYAGQLEYTINELDKSVPAKLKENLNNITRRMDRIRNNTDFSKLVFRSKDYEYGKNDIPSSPTS